MATRKSTSSPKTRTKKTATAKKSCTPKATRKPCQIVVKYNAGFNNFLSIRGSSAGLSWDKGTPLKNVGPDEWIWETRAPFTDCEFKVLINDENYECGENHWIKPGAKVQYTPNFS